ncbi:hypothetical protein FRC09_014684 [Ceratobasidium sp. 395]|nr:hypothetical protein FRC09_014684 [Ceratobasidium sp. 395]
MPPPRNARRSDISPFRTLESVSDFGKQVQIFGIYGSVRDRVKLQNGDIIVKGDCYDISIEIKQGQDHSETSYSGESWIAKVLEIKGEDKHSEQMELYLLCRWFYSGTNLDRYHDTVINLTRCPFSKNELALSNHQQIIRADTVLRKVSVRFFNEFDQEQTSIGREELWYRFNFRVGNGAMDNRLVLGENQNLPPGRCAVETCTKRYKPDADYQRFCPRTTCKLWYHNQCLEDHGYERTDKRSQRSHQLEALLTGTDGFLYEKDHVGREVPEVPAEFHEWIGRQVKKEAKGGSGCRFPKYEVGSISNLVWCAQTPISRGRKYGVVGNQDIVAKARSFLREIWEDRKRNSWPADEDIECFSTYNKPPKQRLYSCIRCGSTI